MLERQQGIVIVAACGVLLIPCFFFFFFFPNFFSLQPSKHPILMLFFDYLQSLTAPYAEVVGLENSIDEKYAGKCTLWWCMKNKGKPFGKAFRMAKLKRAQDQVVN